MEFRGFRLVLLRANGSVTNGLCMLFWQWSFIEKIRKTEVSQILHFQTYKVTSHGLWPSFVIFGLCTCVDSYIIAINHSLVSIGQEHFKWGQISHFQPIFKFDLDELYLNMWHLTLSTSEGSHVASMTHVWFKSNFNFSSKAKFYILAYLKIRLESDLRWPLTIKWPLNDLWTQQTYPYYGFHIIRRKHTTYEPDPFLH